MKLNGNALGLALGTIWGATIFFATIMLLVKAGMGLHYEAAMGVGPTLKKIGQFYMGYDVTIPGAIVGGVYGFVHAYITARILALIYNKFSEK